MGKYTTEVTNREMIDIIRRMALLAQHGNPDIKKHLERVRGYCYVLARGLDLSHQDAEMLSIASLLHDIGEVAIPESVLMKSSKLTPYEWELVKRHPVTGAELLRGSPSVILQAGEIIALTHHERWDGSGYPHGIQEEAIPVSGRICALADIFDALTTKRPYKEEMPLEEACQLIMGSSGTLFDPNLVQIFHQNFDEMAKIWQANT